MQAGSTLFFKTILTLETLPSVWAQREHSEDVGQARWCTAPLLYYRV